MPSGRQLSLPPPSPAINDVVAIINSSTTPYPDPHRRLVTRLAPGISSPCRCRRLRASEPAVMSRTLAEGLTTSNLRFRIALSPFSRTSCRVLQPLRSPWHPPGYPADRRFALGAAWVAQLRRSLFLLTSRRHYAPWHERSLTTPLEVGCLCLPPLVFPISPSQA
jgi:hypothetical protein